MQQPGQTPILKVENLEVTYSTRRGLVRAVRDVSFEIRPGDALGLVGESGCGKSTLAFAVMNHVTKNAEITGGRILFRGEDIARKSGRELNNIRGNEIAMVYQDPMAALNPSLRIGRQLTEVLMEHKGLREAEARARCIRMLERVRIPDPSAIMERYRHQLSGGQQQRVLIAMALLTNPTLLIMDEPTTGLDVTVEAGILDLIGELKQEFGVTILFISHNLGVISTVADRVAVMYAGELVEQGPVRSIFRDPQHPYTAALLGCVPKISAGRQQRTLQPIRGRIPALHENQSGCIFAPRCDRVRERCRSEHPDMMRTAEANSVRCFFAGSPDPAETISFQAEPAGGEPASRGDDRILNIEGLRSYYKAQEAGLAGLDGKRKKGFVKAVDDVTLMAWNKSALGIVGESGCGKTTLAKCIAGLVPPKSGKMDFIGIDVARVVEQRPVELLKELQMIFQNPDSTLNPKRSVGEAIARPLKLFGTVAPSEIRNEVVRLLEAVRLGEAYYDRVPRQLSGGEKQRVALARAFAGRPTLVLCDEPLSSLDVSVQAAVMNLLLEFQRKFETTILLISHDLSVVYQLCDSVAVMYLGRFCEIGSTEALFAPPYHPYTEALLSAVPIPDPSVERTNIRLSGAVPSALDPPSGCRFHTRCPRKIGPICEREPPPWRQTTDGHGICCHIEMEVLSAMEPVLSRG
ncbi:MAG: dipeptide ABC transporter ATP-binding protein [Paracoccaceae bacterium]